MVDKNDPKFGGLLRNFGHVSLETTQSVLDEYNIIVEEMTKKCDEWAKLLKTFLTDQETEIIISLLHPEKSQPIKFGSFAGAKFDLEKLDKFFKDAAARKCFIARNGSKTMEFKETWFARQLGYCLNYINAVGATARIMRNINRGLPPGDEMKLDYIKGLENALPRVQDKLFSLEKPEDCNFDVWRSIFSSAILASDFFKGKKIRKTDWKDMLDVHRESQEAGIPSAEEITDTIDSMLYRMKGAYFGNSIPDLSNSNDVRPTQTDREHKKMQLDIVMSQYVEEIAKHINCTIAEAKATVNFNQNSR